MKNETHFMSLESQDPVWDMLRYVSLEHAKQEPILASFIHSIVLNHDTLEEALSFHLASKLGGPDVSALLLREIIDQALIESDSICEAVRADMLAICERDSACDCLSTPFLFYKGFHALQAYRISHWLWQNKRSSLALFLQNRIATEFSVDIHPASNIGKGIMLDHATGIVIGETAIIENNVSIMQSVTLGGTGKDSGDRHPKVREGVLIGADAKILGNIEIGEGAHISSGSVVLRPVLAHTVVSGVPAKVVGESIIAQPALDMQQGLRCKKCKEPRL